MESELSLPPQLSAKDQSSFAYHTVNARMPVILAQIADRLCRNRLQIAEKHGQEAEEDVKVVIGHLSKLRYEVQTDKPVLPLESKAADVDIWNAELAAQTQANHGKPPSWYTASWLYVECYMYRAIKEFFALTNLLKTFDVFGDQKRAAYVDAALPVTSLLTYLSEVTASVQDNDEVFSKFVQVALWSNKCDLSISQGAANSQKDCLLEQLCLLRPNILADETKDAIAALRSAAAARGGKSGRVDIILDNAGFELVTDLCLAEVLLATGLASTVHFHGKQLPWFVSDVTEEDFLWTLDMMCSSAEPAVTQFGTHWMSRLQNGTWSYKSHMFWTLPYDFSLLQQHAPDLYADLAQTDLVFFKGDLNYRKLVGDRSWEPSTPFIVGLRGFHPAPLCSLRTLKADTVLGLKPGLAQQVEQKDPKWQTSGNWGTISFCGQRVL